MSDSMKCAGLPKEFEWSDTERDLLGELMASPSWQVAQKAISAMAEHESYTYNNIRDEHRYFQGRLHGVLSVISGLRRLSAPVVREEEQEEGVLVGKAAPVNDY